MLWQSTADVCWCCVFPLRLRIPMNDLYWIYARLDSSASVGYVHLFLKRTSRDGRSTATTLLLFNLWFPQSTWVMSSDWLRPLMIKLDSVTRRRDWMFVCPSVSWSKVPLSFRYRCADHRPEREKKKSHRPNVIIFREEEKVWMVWFMPWCQLVTLSN